MTNIKALASGANLQVQVSGELTAGMVGAAYQVQYDSAWEGLGKMVVFSARNASGSEISRNAVDGTVPHEVLKEPLSRLFMGIVGRKPDGTVVIPTIWADLGLVLPAAEPSGDPNAEPDNPIWKQSAAQAQQALEKVQNLEHRADSGEFQGKPGKDYVHSEEFSSLAEQVRRDAQASASAAEGSIQAAGRASDSEQAAAVSSRQAASGAATAQKAAKAARDYAAGASTSAQTIADTAASVQKAHAAIRSLAGQTRTDAETAAQAALDAREIIDDTAVSSSKTRSSQKLYDAFLPELHQTGAIVSCSPAEDYPVKVITRWTPQDSVPCRELKMIRCGKNLLPPNNVPLSGGITYDPESDTYTVTPQKSFLIAEFPGTIPVQSELYLHVNVLNPTSKYPDEKFSILMVDEELNYASTEATFSLDKVIDSVKVHPKWTAGYRGVWLHSWNLQNYTPKIRIWIDTCAESVRGPYHSEIFSVSFDRDVSGGSFDWQTGTLTETHGPDGVPLPVPNLHQYPPLTLTAGAGVNSFYSSAGSTEVYGRLSPQKIYRNQLNKNWEVIQNVSLDQDVNISFDTEPDGTPYWFEAVRITMFLPKDKAKLSTTRYIYIYGKTGICGAVRWNITKSENNYLQIIGTDLCNCCKVVAFYGISDEDLSHCSASIAYDHVHLPYRRFASYLELDAGTTIKIEAVRSDE